MPHVLHEGATILAGRPKVGKGWFALLVPVAIAAGGRALGRIAVEQGSALYIGLEDGERRLQERLQDLLRGEPAPDGLDIATEWPRLNEGGVSLIGGWLDAHPNARLVVIDTLKRVRPLEQRGASLYGQDYDAVAGLTDMSHKYRICILIIHHTRKGDSDDPIELTSGSLGLCGGQR